MQQKTPTRIHRNQEGVVTIVIVILIMLLMSLIVLAMSRNASREQRQALDRQLNSQAFYAAESGINNFLAEINNLPDESDDCEDQTLSGPLVAGSVIEVTCVLYDKTPDTLIFSEITLSEAKVVPLQSADGIGTLNISFEGKDVTSPSYNGCNSFNGENFPPRPVNNCSGGILRLEIIRSNSARSELLSETTTLFIVPSNSSGTGNYSYDAGQQGKVVRANCHTGNTPNDCKININNLGLGPNQRMYLSMRSIYQPNALEVGSNSGSFKNAQIMVDSTGKANDILKRLQVRIPVHALSGAVNPSFSVQSSTDVCKLLQVMPNNTTSTECPTN
jgi:type IV pilus assembly PilX-like protein